MASYTQMTKRKRANRRQRMGHARKLAQGKRSTVSQDELFDGCGEPGKPAPPATASAKTETDKR